MTWGKTKLLLGVAAIGLTAVPGYAQSAAPTKAEADAETANQQETKPDAPASVPVVADKDAKVSGDDIIITGTRIVRPNMTSNAPVTSIDQTFLKSRGLARVEDVLSQLPQVTPMLGLQGTSWTSGQSRVGLRNLGAGRTLTLLNGQRADNDVGIIPGALIERVDILTGGASAVYGSDAIAGVVNFIVKRRYNGIAFDGEVSGNQHRNDNPLLLKILDESGYPRPQKDFLGGGNFFASVAAGKDLFNGDVNVSGYVVYKKAAPMRFSDLDTTGCPVLANRPFSDTPNANDTYACDTNEYNPYNYFYANGADYTNARDGSRAWRPYDAEADVVRVPQTDYIQREDNTINTGGFVSANLFSDVKLDGSFLYTRYKQNGANSVNAAYFTPEAMVNCDNPFLGAGQAQVLCGAAAGTQASAPLVATLWRPNFTQTFRFSTQDWRGSIGLSGSVIGKIRFQASYQRSRNTNRYASDNIYDYDTGTVKFARGLQVRNVNGKPTCLSVIDGTDPTCVPIDMFSATTPVNQAVFDWLAVNGNSFQQSDQEIYSGVLSGTLEEYGIKSPFATEGLGFAMVAERRSNRIQSEGFGAFSTWTKFDGRTTVKELGFELDLPLVQNVRFIEDLSVNGGYRISNYDTYNDLVRTWKAEASYAPFAGLRFRGSYNKALRVGIQERLEGQNRYANHFTLDLCAPPGAGSTLQRFTYEQCAAGGMTRQQYDALTNYNGCNTDGYCPTTLINGGNPGLRPERSRSVTVGMVMQPKFAPGFSATIDGYDIKIVDAFEWARVGIAFDQCYRIGTPYFCGLYKRDAQTGRVTEVDGRYANSGGTRTRGIDIAVNYLLDPSKMGIDAKLGTFNLGFNGTRTLKFERQFAPGNPTWSCLSYFGFGCGGPMPAWRHFANLNWNLPWVKGGIGLTWRYIAGTRNSKLSSNPVLAARPTPDFPDAYPLAQRLPSASYFDLSTNIDLTKRISVRFNVQNLLDRDPPLVPTDSTYGIGAYFNTFPAYYDVRGRTLRVGLSARL